MMDTCSTQYRVHRQGAIELASTATQRRRQKRNNDRKESSDGEGDKTPVEQNKIRLVLYICSILLLHYH